MTTVHHHCQLDGSWSTMVVQSLECSPHSSTREKNIIDKNHRATSEIEWNVRWCGQNHRAKTEIISIHGDIDSAKGNLYGGSNAIHRVT
jgi:hypothetical protein